MKSDPFIFNKKKFAENFKIHSNLDITKFSLNNFPCLYKEILTRRSKYLSFPVSLPSKITSQFLWFSIYIKVDRKCIYFRDFSKKGLNFVRQLFELKGKLKNWIEIKDKYHALESKRYQWRKLVDALETPWKQAITNLIVLVFVASILLKKP